MIASIPRAALALLLAAAAGLPVACADRKAPGGAGPEPSVSGFLLDGVYFARGIDEGHGLSVISPLTFVRTDPLTGRLVPGSIQPIAGDGDVRSMVSFGLGPDFSPSVVPRNAVLVLEFSRPLDPGSVRPDRFAGDSGATLPGHRPRDLDDVLTPGSIQIRDPSGRGVPVTLTVRDNLVFVDPRGEVPGFPPGPRSLATDGTPLRRPGGALRLVLPRAGDTVVRATDGTPLEPRPDRLGTRAFPIGFDPGNERLDFISADHLLPEAGRFNGFLPDRTSPRIVRRHEIEGVLDLAAGDFAGAGSLFLHDAHFEPRAHGGLGEWAGARLTVRPGRPSEESHVVARHDERLLAIDDTFIRPPAGGDVWHLRRLEAFEPDPTDPIDPDLWDPFDPENDRNARFENFILFEEIDESGHVADANADGRTLYHAWEKIPSRSIVKVRFDEPIDPASLGAYESMRVTPRLEPTLTGDETVGRVVTQDGGRVAVFWPVRQDPLGDEFPGLAPNGLIPYYLVLRTAPDLEFLSKHLPGRKILEFLDEGHRLITDLAGCPLAFAARDFDPSKIVIQYFEEFEVETTPGGHYPDVAATVHLFRGRPSLGFDPETQTTGVWFRDKEDPYNGHLADFNLTARGCLQGAPVIFSRRIADDAEQNHLPEDPFNPWPGGSPIPLGASTLNDIVYSAVWGARFQHVYRVLDCSIAPYGDLAGSLSHLFRISVAPEQGRLSPEVYEDISIHAAHSDVLPNTTESLGVPNDQFSGIGIAFDTETWLDPAKPCGSSIQEKANYIDPLETVVPAGTTWTLSPANLADLPGSTHPFLPWPDLARPFPYDNSHSLLLEYRFRPQETAVSLANSFAFSPGMWVSPFPRFRVFSLGSANNTLLPDAGLDEDRRARCAVGPLPKPQRFGDNARYFYAFDYMKTVSIIRSPFLRAVSTGDPIWRTPILDPPLDRQPAGTSILLELRAAESPAAFSDDPEGGWTTDVTELAGLDWIQFRVHLEGDPDSRLTPVLDTLQIPYERGDSEFVEGGG